MGMNTRNKEQPLEGELVTPMPGFNDLDPVIGHEIPHDFIVGDIVTHRLGGGRWRVTSINHCGDLVEVECMDATDATIGGEPWCKVGDREFNLTRRYELMSRAGIDLKPE